MANKVEQISDSDDSNEMFDPLAIEKRLIHEAMLEISRSGLTTIEANRKKNAADSIQYRKKGNELYNSDSHSSQKHLEILDLYSKSMALAPTNSEELALSYGNRAALLCHMKKYEECIKDCERALDITVSDYLEAKLLCRKAECLVALNDKMAKYVCEEALELFKQLTLDKGLKSNFIEKLNNIKNSCLNDKSKKNKISIEKQQEIPLAFTRQKEVPCASEAVKIKYSKKWGRHIVATQDIEPGDIIAVEKNNYRFTFTEKMYCHCSNCSKFTWSSIPCKLCIYGVYCSEECRIEAWEKFHKFECEIYPLLWDIDKDIIATPCTLRLLLNATHEVGGIPQLKKVYLDLEKNKDQRTKGFSADGVFHSDICTSVLSLTSCKDDHDHVTMSSFVQNAAVALFFLANNTTFFGKKLVLSAIELLKFEDVSFIGALLLKIFYLLSRNNIMHVTYHSEIVESRFGIIANPFCSLFNHSCDPNVKFIYSKNNEIIVYARYPIKKGEQLFRTYFTDFLGMPKDMRQASLLKAYNFKCDCQPCKENWSNICLPELKDMIGARDRINLFPNLPDLHILRQNVLFLKKFQYSPETWKELKRFLRVMAAGASVHCYDYALFEDLMFRAYNEILGYWVVIPDAC